MGYQRRKWRIYFLLSTSSNFSGVERKIETITCLILISQNYRMQHFFPFTYRYIARSRKQLVCTLHEDAISFTVQKKNRIAKSYHYNYSDIDRIHLSLPDVSWHTIDIYFKDKTRIHMKSVLFFTEKQEGKLRRLKSNEEDNALVRELQNAYSEFVIALHERLNLYESHKGIKFTHGNPWKKVLIGSVLIALIFLIPIAWQLGNYRLVFVWLISFIFLFLFYRIINFRKKYSPRMIPQKYLPRLL